MPSIQSYVIRYALRFQKWRYRHRHLSLDVHRRLIDKIGERAKPFEGVSFVEEKVNGLDAEWIIPPTSKKDRVILYFHGGAYQVGSLRSHRHLVSQIAGASQLKALLIDYRLAPEHPFPAGVEDAFLAYQWLLSQGYHNVYLAGDSAGAGLALACMQKIKQADLPMPTAAILISPWVDLTASHDSIERLANKDPLLSKKALLACANQYVSARYHKDPLVSPLFADLSGFPPLLIQLGALDILLDEGQHLATRAQQAGVKVTLEVWPNMIHVWHMLVGRLPEAQRAIQHIAAFVWRW